MQIQAQASALENPFAAARKQFGELIDELAGARTRTMTHADVERLIAAEGNEVMRLLFQGHLDARGPGEAVDDVVGFDGVERRYARMMDRRLKTVFGTVTVSRVTYSAHETPYLAPRDAELNLPPELYSHGLQRRVANEVAKTSFDESVASLEQTTGTTVPKRQVEQLAARAAEDFDAFYEARSADSVREAKKMGPILVLSVDGKGIVMRHEDLREATRRAAEKRTHKIPKRLSKGEKPNSKRMATVAAVYTIAASPRTPEDIVKGLAPVRDTSAPRPRAEHKRVWASVEKTPEQVIEEIFVEAERRDPAATKEWVALVDGNLTQLDLLRKAAKRHGVDLVIVLDLIHVTEYLWDAAFDFHEEGDPRAQRWVSERLLEILRGKSSEVAGGIRRSATLRGILTAKRVAVDDCADYLVKYRALLRYDEYLAAGYPIATGVIEGACRHLIKDRLDITGARWGLEGAEAILRLRSIRSSGDFNDYWTFHEGREWLRHHVDTYRGLPPPTITPKLGKHRHLSIAK